MHRHGKSDLLPSQMQKGSGGYAEKFVRFMGLDFASYIFSFMTMGTSAYVKALRLCKQTSLNVRNWSQAR